MKARELVALMPRNLDYGVSAINFVNNYLYPLFEKLAERDTDGTNFYCPCERLRNEVVEILRVEGFRISTSGSGDENVTVQWT